MQYEKTINLLDNTLNQPFKFRTKNWVEVNYDYGGIQNTNSQIKFKITNLKLASFDYSDAFQQCSLKEVK